MKLEFTKMCGCGNDFICVNGFKFTVPDPAQTALKLCDRHFGIGADGLIIVRKCDEADIYMEIYNSDGSIAKMCGNGIRCVGKFAYEKGLVGGTDISVGTLSGVKKLTLDVKNGEASYVTVDMGVPRSSDAVEVKLDGGNVTGYPVDIGNPHCVLFMQDIESLNIKNIADIVSKLPEFPEGVNTEFIEIKGNNTLNMRVWERGCGETLACGTGACASVVAACKNGYAAIGEDVSVTLPGGTLTINYDGNRIIMGGKVEKTFEGFAEV